MKRSLLTLLVVAPLAACSWGIKLDSGGEKVRAAWNQDVGAGCKEMGKITVSVADHVGPINRSGLKVSDELEVMARNEGARMGADTVQPVGEPQDGEQSWRAFHCGPAARDKPAMHIQQRGKDGSVETFPVKN